MSNVPPEPLPLSLYVHLPWCVRKCPYCDFNSHPIKDGPPFSRYVDALLDDLATEANRAAERPIISLFLGGGTPSLFPAAEIKRLLDGVRRELSIAEPSEVTMELNPGALEHEALAAYGEAGVNRLSIGAQSFEPDSLRALGRIHRVGEISRAVVEARAAGFRNINLDIMYALPGQNEAKALEDLQRAIDLEPEHLSWYELTLEPNTVFYRHPPPGLPDEACCEAIREAGQALLAANGFEQYEVSAYARAGNYCRHNLNYWSFGDYLGIGAGAHGKVTLGDTIYRSKRVENPRLYLESVGEHRHAEYWPVEPDERIFEFMLNALRLRAGFSESLFSSRTRLPAERVRGQLEYLSERRLVERADPDNWRPSALGQRFLNDVQAAFLP